VNCWDKENLVITPDLPRHFGAPKHLNDAVAAQLRLVEAVIEYAERKGIADKGAFVKTYYSPGLDIYSLSDLVQKKEEEKRQEELAKQKADLDVFNQIEKYITSQTPRVCKDMPRIYRNMRDHLRTFLINREKKKIIQPVDLTDWDVVGEEVDAEYLDWIEIGKMWTVDLSGHPHLIPYRADFVLGCLTGLRFSDFSILEQPDVRGDFLYKKQGKSKHWVVIPLRKIAREILEDRFRTAYTPLTNAEFNRHIKTVAKSAGIEQLVKHYYRKGNKWFEEVKPKCEWITSHTCRRSFCTNEFLAGTPVELIMKISGHKSTKDFYRYIRITPEQAALIIKDIWEKRGTMLTKDMISQVGGKGLPVSVEID